MATIRAGIASPPVAVTMATGLTGNTSSDVVDRGAYRGPAAIVITNTAGATPTVTVDIKGSVDGTAWFNVAYSLVATPETVAVAAITITSAVTTTYLLRPNHAWRYLRVDTTSNTNETLDITYYQ